MKRNTMKDFAEGLIVDDGADALDLLDEFARAVSGYDRALGNALGRVWQVFADARADADTKAIEEVAGMEF